jgi:hypothetical protein
MARKRKPVGCDELREAILRMIVERFGDRELSWETAELALALAGFEIKQAALFAPAVGSHPRVPPSAKPLKSAGARSS